MADDDRTALFTLGSGISGGASNIEMLIAGRLTQGIGASGITVLTEIIICDLLPLRERGRYLGIMLGTYKSPKHPHELIQGDIPSSQSLTSLHQGNAVERANEMGELQHGLSYRVSRI